MENKLGLLNDHRIMYGGKDYTSVLKGRKINSTKFRTRKIAFELLESWLERTPFLSFKGFDFWKQYSNAVRSMLKKEKLVIQNNPNYSQKEVEYHLNEHENAVLSFEAMINEERQIN